MNLPGHHSHDARCDACAPALSYLPGGTSKVLSGSGTLARSRRDDTCVRWRSPPWCTVRRPRRCFSFLAFASHFIPGPRTRRQRSHPGPEWPSGGIDLRERVSFENRDGAGLVARRPEDPHWMPHCAARCWSRPDVRSVLGDGTSCQGSGVEGINVGGHHVPLGSSLAGPTPKTGDILQAHLDSRRGVC